MKVLIAALLFAKAASERSPLNIGRNDDELDMMQIRSSFDIKKHGQDSTEINDWSICNSKVTSNLGGLGGVDVDGTGKTISSSGNPDEIRFYRVSTLGDGTSLDLIMTNLTEYTANTVSNNGRDDCLGQINIKAPGKVKIRFAFVLHGTNTLAPPATKHFFTLLDFDKSKLGMTEIITVDQSFEAIAQTDMTWTRDASGGYVFQAKPESIAIPNPTDPYDLTTAQQNAAVGLQYYHTSSWDVTFEAEMVGDSNQGGGRNFLFAGRTQLQGVATPEPVPTPAPTPPTPAPTPPTPAPTPPTPAPTPAPTPCPVPLVCACSNNPQSSYDSYVNWQMCTSDVETGPGGYLPMRYKHVAPQVDLLVENLTSYDAKAADKNGRSGCLGQLNLAAPGDVTIRFALVKSGTNDLVDAGPTYDMTVFDFDGSKKGMVEVVGVSGYSNLESVGMKPAIKGGTAWFQSTEIEVENPTSIDDMTPEQLAASFSVSYTATSEWTIQFGAEESQTSRRNRQQGGRNFLFSGTSCASAGRHECHCPLESPPMPEKPPPMPEKPPPMPEKGPVPEHPPPMPEKPPPMPEKGPVRPEHPPPMPEKPPPMPEKGPGSEAPPPMPMKR